MIDLDSYLVKLGFKVDIVALDSFLNVLEKGKKALTKTDTEAEKTAISVVKNYATTVAAVIAAVGKMVGGVAQADQEMSINAKKNWMRKDTFTEMTLAAEALGLTLDELSDIRLDSELLSEFRELRSIAHELQPSEETLSWLSDVRGIMYDIKEFGLMAKYFIMNLGASIAKELNPEITELRGVLSEIGQFLIDNFPEILDAVTSILVPILRIALQLFIGIGKVIVMALPYILKLLTLLGKVFDILEPLWNLIGDIIKLVSDFFVAFGPILEGVLGLLTDILDIIDALLNPEKFKTLRWFGNVRDLLIGMAENKNERRLQSIASGTQADNMDYFSDVIDAANGSSWYENNVGNNISTNNNTSYDYSRRNIEVTNYNTINSNDPRAFYDELTKKNSFPNLVNNKYAI